MKKYFMQTCTSVLLLLLMVIWNGCDEFNHLPLNIPFTLKFEMHGSNTTIADSTASYCLSTDSDTYDSYRDRIRSLHFIEAAYRTLSVTPADLTGDITITVKDGDNKELFSYTIPDATPADYLKPHPSYILQLTQAQIDIINAYLDSLLDVGACFKGTVTVKNITGQPPYSLNGAVDMVIEADTEL